MEERVRQERLRMQKQQVVDNAQTTHDIYAEMERALRTKFAQEERIKLTKLRKELDAEFKQEISKKES